VVSSCCHARRPRCPSSCPGRFQDLSKNWVDRRGEAEGFRDLATKIEQIADLRDAVCQGFNSLPVAHRRTVSSLTSNKASAEREVTAPPRARNRGKIRGLASESLPRFGPTTVPRRAARCPWLSVIAFDSHTIASKGSARPRTTTRQGTPRADPCGPSGVRLGCAWNPVRSVPPAPWASQAHLHERKLATLGSLGPRRGRGADGPQFGIGSGFPNGRGARMAASESES
jgi:hypothetical protein